MGSSSTVRHAKELISAKEVSAICFHETKTTDARRLLKMAQRLGFTKYFMVELLGFAGDILLLWRPYIFDFELVRHTTQIIHGWVKGSGGFGTWISFTYVRPNMRAKEIFWDERT